MSTHHRQRDRSIRREPLPKIVMEDLRRGDLRRTLSRDLRDVYDFYLTEESRETLRTKGRVKRWFLVVVWVAKNLILNLPPLRRLFFLLSLACFLIGDVEFTSAEFSFGLHLTGIAFLCLLFILLLELKDKLLARDELETGRAVQLSLLPREAPAMAGWDVHFFTRPANDVGGDLVDYLPVADGGMGWVLGDVAGKGLGAALLMAKLQASIRAIATLVGSLSELGTRMNAVFLRDQIPGRYATLVYLELHAGSGSIRLLNAGHLPPVRLGRLGVASMEPTSPPIGLLAGASYAEQRLELEPGDALLVYSDGITEARNGAGEFYGDERLLELVATLRNRPAREAIQCILTDVERFVGEERYPDDVSVIFLRRLPD